MAQHERSGHFPLIAANYFGTTRARNTAGSNGYATWSAWDTQGREWKFQKDVSIHGADDEKCELVTPILNYEDIETLQGLLRALRKAGAKSSPSRGCGVHIHVGLKSSAGDHMLNMHASHKPQQPDNEKYSLANTRRTNGQMQVLSATATNEDWRLLFRENTLRGLPKAFRASITLSNIQCGVGYS